MAIPAAIADALSDMREWEDRAWFPPGAQLAICLPDEAGLTSLSDAELVEVMAAARRQTAWAQARELAAIAELSRRRHQEDDADDDGGYGVLSAHESLLEEVASALTVTGNAAATLVHVADRLTTALPATRAALEAGRIDLAKARVICDAVDGLADDVAERVEAAVLAHAPAQTTGQLRRRAKRAAQRLAPEHFEDRKKDVVAGRRLEVWESAHDTAALGLLDVATDDARAIHNKITAVARAVKSDGDDRTLDQIRADLATELLRGNPLPDAIRLLCDQNTPPARAVPASSEGPTAAATRPGMSESDAAPELDADIGPGAPGLPAGAIATQHDSDLERGVPGRDVAVARSADAGMVEPLAVLVDRRLNQVLAHARATGRMHALAMLTTRATQQMSDRLAELRDTWCQMAENGNPEGHGEHRYRPSAGLRRSIQLRHPTCVFPTCNTRSDRCDLDHTVTYDTHGPTCGCNLAPLCRRHHRTKQTRGWRLFQIWPGLLVWITPSGTWRITLATRQ